MVKVSAVNFSEGPYFGTAPGGDVDVDVTLVEVLGDAKLSGPRGTVAEGRLRRLLHNITELTRELQLAGAGPRVLPVACPNKGISPADARPCAPRLPTSVARRAPALRFRILHRLRFGGALRDTADDARHLALERTNARLQRHPLIRLSVHVESALVRDVELLFGDASAPRAAWMRWRLAMRNFLPLFR